MSAEELDAVERTFSEELDAEEQRLFGAPVHPKVTYLSEQALSEMEKTSGVKVKREGLIAVVDDDGGFLCWAIENY